MAVADSKKTMLAFKRKLRATNLKSIPVNESYSDRQIKTHPTDTGYQPVESFGILGSPCKTVQVIISIGYILYLRQHIAKNQVLTK